MKRSKRTNASKRTKRTKRTKQAPAPARAKRTKSSDPIVRVRRISLALPDAHEVIAWGEPTFRVRNKMFATYASANTHHGQGRPCVWIKSTPFTQDQLVRSEPGRFFVPPYVGPNGWVGIYLDKRPNWTVVASLLEDAYKLIAPKRFSSRLGAKKG